MIDVFTRIVLAGAFIFTFAWVILAQRRTIRLLSDAYLRLTHFQRVLVALAVIVCTVYAQKPSTNDVNGVSGTNDVEGVTGTNQVGGIVLNVPQPMSNGASFLGGCGALGTVRPTVAVRPYRLESVTTNESYSYTMPADGAICGTWRLTGAYEDVQRVALDGFAFPLGSDLCTSLWVYTWGKVRPQLRNASNEIAAVGAPMSAIPEVSRFWTAATSNDTYLLTWENFVAGRLPAPATRDASGMVNAQIELFRNGDFITRSNDVELVWRRVIEPNPIGPINPVDPDNPSMPIHPYGPVQDLSVIEESDAYCWVDIVVNTADAWVRFEGDGASNLADPSFAAKAGETNHVVILIGKTYKVTCDMPFTVVGKSNPAIDEWWEDGNTLWLNWPVSVEAWEGNGKSFMMHVVPNFLGGAFAWTNSCCSVTGSGIHFSYSCDGHCRCTGCSASGYYHYEGYRIGCNGSWCGCSYDPDDDYRECEPDDGPYAPGVSVSFSDRAVIFEDAYEESPGVVVGKHSTVVYLECVVHGGPNGGTATFTFTGRDKLDGGDLPTSVAVPAEHCVRYRILYQGESPSGSDEDIVVHGDFTENGPDGETCSDEDKLTCVKLELEAQYTAPQNASQGRHTYGVGELVKFKVAPVVSGEILRVVKADAGDNVTDYDTFGGSLEIAPAAENVYRCPATGTSPDVTLCYKGAEYSPVMSVIEPQSVEVLSVTREGTFWPGDVCMGLMVSRVHVKPFTVSFSGVQIYEVPCTNAIPPTGYFASDYYRGPKTHVYPNAGYLHIPDAENYVMTDRAGRTVAYTNWFAGTLTWKVPIGWRRMRRGYENQLAALEVDYALYDNAKSRPLLIGGREDAYAQTFEIESNGTSSIRKFGYKLERNRWIPFGIVTQTGED